MVQIQDGNIETVYPVASKTADVLFPMDWAKIRGTGSPGFELPIFFITLLAVFEIRRKLKK